jgi:hypothetical protein
MRSQNGSDVPGAAPRPSRQQREDETLRVQLEAHAEAAAVEPPRISRVIGEEVSVGKYGVGRVTEIGPPDRTGLTTEPEWIGVTPHAAGYQMEFAPGNVSDAPPSRNAKLIAAADAIDADAQAKRLCERIAFDGLSPEGKLSKIRQHLNSPLGYPVPSKWVRWLVEQL